MLECKKCSYFDPKKNYMHKNFIVVGFCNLRGKFVTDRSISNEKCSEKAIIDPEKVEEVKKKAEDTSQIEYAFRVDERKKQFVTF